jgi:hypothetical protein
MKPTKGTINVLERVKRVVREKPRAGLTESHYQQLARAYEHFNETLFAGILPPVEGTPEAEDSDVLVVFTSARKGIRSYGHVARDRWNLRSGGLKTIHEVNMNPDHFHRHDTEICATLVHEQVHVWQIVHCDGQPASGYHNREWADKMIAIGLMPSHDGSTDGRQTGHSMHHYPIEAGVFIKACKQLADTGFKFQLESKAHPGKDQAPKTSKVKVTCPQCGQNAWGKDGLDVRCGVCPDRPRMLSKDELEAWQKQHQKAKAAPAPQRVRGLQGDAEQPAPQRVKRQAA